jgi:adenylate kinase
MRIILVGAPGSGKGTQSELLKRKYQLPQVATGDLLRSAISEGTPLGEKARAYVTAGALVPDDLILALVAERLDRPEAADGFILDGFPRSIPQADGLDEILRRKGVALDVVIKLDVNKRVLLERLTSRRICPGCGSVYNLLTAFPPSEGTCGNCGSRLVQREDDTEATVRRRLNVYESSTAPLIDYYDGRHLLRIVNGEGPVETVFERIVAVLGRKTGPSGL